MTTLEEIISKIEAPLVFSTKNNYSHLKTIKSLESAIHRYLHELSEYLARSALSEGDKQRIGIKIAEIKDFFLNFDCLPADEKKIRLKNALSTWDELKNLVNHSNFEQIETKTAPPAATQDIPDAETCFEKLSVSVQFVKGVGPKIANLLARKGINNVEELLYFLPRQYEDRRLVKTIKEALPGRKETLMGVVGDSQIRSYGRAKILEVKITDGRDLLTAKWFRGNFAYLRRNFKKGTRLILTGEVKSYLFEKEILHPDFEILGDEKDDSLHFKRIVPIYSETEGLNQKVLRRIMMHAVNEYSPYFLSPIPDELCRKRRLSDFYESMRNLHFPDSTQDIELYNEMRSPAHRRLIYDEFFFFQLGMALKKSGKLLNEGISFKTQGPLLKQFYKNLPFRLTKAQERVIGEIESDMAKKHSMNRLLQGDVGCGKTVVSMAAMITACENLYQAAIMAPTEILAEQHFNNIKSWSDSLGLQVVLLTSSKKAAERKNIYEEIKEGKAHIIIGTHALIQEAVIFRNLGLVIIDEQHRFGVAQRAQLREKGVNPDVLVMTATPIPRTLAMTVYGDLDVSVIDEMPPGKKSIKTKIFFETQRQQVYDAIRVELKKGHQAFIVYPLIEESETLDLLDATRMAEHLQRDVLPEYRVGLIHGKLKGKQKEALMRDFLAKKLDVLGSTTVIEVGIDIPEASLIVIEHAERFGLSQLHQLRGRVGRSQISSYCILMAQRNRSDDARKRLQIMEQTNDGFKIAEADLAIRGPGELMGLRQAGLPDFRIAHIARDAEILAAARADALSLVESDSLLENQENALLRKVLLKRWQGRLELARTG
jgi:ATP-dependent DNA helicase RecG